MVTIGRWEDSTADDELSKMFSNPDARFEFVSSVLDFIEEHSFDGLDLNWVPPVCLQVTLCLMIFFR